MINPAIHNYWCRFGNEIAAYCFLSVFNSVYVMRRASMGVASVMAVVEVVALAWITVRLVLAEDGFRTNGGWRSRPYSRAALSGLSLVAALLVVLIPAILRGAVCHQMFGDSLIWTSLAAESWIWQLCWWFVFFALPIKLFGSLILKGIDGRQRVAAWAVLSVVLMPVIGLVAGRLGAHDRERTSVGIESPGILAQGIQQELIGATDFIGAWYEPVADQKVPSARLLAKVSLDSGRTDADMAVRSSSASLRGGRVIVRVRGYALKEVMSLRLNGAGAVLRFPNGTIATSERTEILRSITEFPFFPVSEWSFEGEFFSPHCLPEFEGDPQALTRGLELLFFEPDWDKPQIKVDPRRKQNRGGSPETFRFQPGTMDELFTQFPWPDDVWEKTARPFLLARATAKDVPLLLDKLEMDNRLMSVFIGKGWRDEAMPVLRKLLKERIPMGIDCIEELAREQDPSLAGDLKAVALHHTRGLERLEKALRSQPGFDWRGYVLEAWKRQKYSNNWLEPWGEFWIIALWAAREGDFTAFRLTAERAALGKTWEQQQLAGLVAGDPPDMLEFLRRNIDTMKFDAETRRWFLPAG